MLTCHLFILLSACRLIDRIIQPLKQFSSAFVFLAALLQITSPKYRWKKETCLLLRLCSAELNTLTKDTKKGGLVLRETAMQYILLSSDFATKELTFRRRAGEQAGGSSFFTSHSKVCLSSSIKGDRPCLKNPTQ